MPFKSGGNKEMKKINLKILMKFIYVIIALSIFDSSNSFAEPKSTEFIFGKVVYSDNFSPVEEGNIRVILNGGRGEGRIIETVSIQSNGVFKITKKSVEETDGIKIMAYPNDLDNDEEPPYEPAVIDASNALVNSEGENTFIIKVDRIKSKINKSQGFKESKNEKTHLLKQNFPNPFNPSTLITFDLPQSSTVTLKVYNMNGESVAILVDNKTMTRGTNTLEFNAGNLPSGIYVYSIQAGDFSETRKMMLLK